MMVESYHISTETATSHQLLYKCFIFVGTTSISQFSIPKTTHTKKELHGRAGGVLLALIISKCDKRALPIKENKGMTSTYKIISSNYSLITCVVFM